MCDSRAVGPLGLAFGHGWVLETEPSHAPQRQPTLSFRYTAPPYHPPTLTAPAPAPSTTP